MLTVAVLAALIHAAAPRGSSYAPHETAEERSERYTWIALDVLVVSASEPPLPGLSREQTALVLLAVADHESGFAADVDSGDCAATHLGRCDGGRAVGLMQVLHRGPADRAALRDRRAMFRRGLEVLRVSHRTCPRSPFAVYAGGSCERPSALAAGAELAAYAGAWRDRALGR